MKYFTTFALLCSFATLCVAAPEDAKPEKEKFTAKCPVSGAKASKDQAVDYKKGEVYFCCGKCKAAFDAKKEKHAIKANAQLVATKQYKQTGCPFSGGKAKDDATVKVSGVKVGFCCNNCSGKVADAKSDAQLAMVFSNKAFEKGFKPVKKEETK